jgi:hypothetical protein
MLVPRRAVVALGREHGNSRVSPQWCEKHPRHVRGSALDGLESGALIGGTQPALPRRVGGLIGPFGKSGLVGSGNVDNRSQSLNG